jgi:hypothetical protein
MWWEMRSVRLKADEPSVQGSLEPQSRWGNFFDLIITNIGNVPVYKLRIRMEPVGLKTIGDRKLEDLNLFKKAIPVFTKGANMSTFAISYVDFINSKQPKQITFIVNYETATGKKYEQQFDFDMEVYINMSASSESSLSDVVHKMEDMTKEISKIAKHFDMKALKELAESLSKDKVSEK